MSESFKISIVIRCLNELENLKVLFPILKNQLFKNFEIIFVDSGSTDGSMEYVEELKKDKFLEIKILTIKKEEFTFGRSLNIGFCKAEGEVVVSLSAHCFPTSKHWLDYYLQSFDKSDSIGIVYGRQIAYKLSKYSEQSVLGKLFPESSGLQDHSFNNNGNSATLKSLWEQNNFDESLSGLEDINYAKFVLENDKKIFYSSEACVEHYHDETFVQIKNRYKREAFALKIIYPKKIKSLSKLFLIFLKDLKFDFSNRKSSKLENGKKVVDIYRYRLNQFLGTHEGFQKDIFEKYDKSSFYLGKK